MLFLAGIVIVAVKQWFTGQVIGKRKILVMFTFLSPLVSHFTHMNTHTPFTKIRNRQIRHGVGVVVVNYITMNIL